MSMNIETMGEYSEFVRQLASADSTADRKSMMATAGLGLAGETGEIADTLKKLSFHGMPWNDKVRQKLVLEAGDLLWYLVFLCEFVLEVGFDDVMAANVGKLSERYKSMRFTAEEAADKADEAVY